MENYGDSFQPRFFGYLLYDSSYNFICHISHCYRKNLCHKKFKKLPFPVFNDRAVCFNTFIYAFYRGNNDECRQYGFCETNERFIFNNLRGNVSQRVSFCGEVYRSSSDDCGCMVYYCFLSGRGHNHNSVWKTELDGFRRKVARRVEARDGRKSNSASASNLLIIPNIY